MNTHIVKQKSLKTSIIAIIIFFAISSTCKASDSPVTQIILKPWPHIKPMVIRNLPQISRIISAGKYAWALDKKDSLYAYFDGEHWSEGQAISGISNLDNIIPSYPETGLQPTGWAFGRTSDLKPILSYFNGTTWSTPQLISELFGDIKQNISGPCLDTTNGNTFLVAQADSGIGTPYYQRNTAYLINQKGKGWSSPNLLPELNYYSRRTTALNDNDSALLMLDFYGPRKLYRINDNNEKTIYDFADKLDYDDLYEISTENKSIYLAGFKKIAYTHDDQTWNVIRNFGNSETQERINNGLICNFLHQGSDHLPSAIGCVNTRDQNPKWKLLSLPLPKKSQTYSWKFYTKSTGAWYIINYDKSQYLGDYNFADNTLTEVQIPDNLQNIRPINNISDDLMICGQIDKKSVQHPKLFYYTKINNTDYKWQEIDTSTINVNQCNNANSKDVIWLYESTDK